MDTNIHSLTLNGHRFKIQLRDIVWLLTTFVAGVSIYFASQAKLDKNTDSIARGISAATEDRLKLWNTINYMNEHGTTHSHLVDEKQQQSIDLLGQDFADLNKQVRDLAPKVDKIDTNVLWLMSKQLERK